jgi:hypothetical protein
VTAILSLHLPHYTSKRSIFEQLQTFYAAEYSNITPNTNPRDRFRFASQAGRGPALTSFALKERAITLISH